MMVAAMIVVTITLTTLLGIVTSTASAGEKTANGAIIEAAGLLSLRPGTLAVRGDIDIDGDDVIDLGGNDLQAVAKITFTVASEAGVAIDLTPPYSVDDTLIDPDLSGLDSRTAISLSTGDVHILKTAWTVSMLGDTDGDFILEPAERAEITVWLHSYDWTNALYDLGVDSDDPFIDLAAELLQGRGEFNLQVAVPEGGTLTFSGTLPVQLESSDLLD